MSFQYNSTGFDPNAQFPLLPEGQWFPFEIFETQELTSKKKGYPMILAKCRVTGDPRYTKMKVHHYVVFIPLGKDGDGINIHFRKCIGVPYGGDDVVDADDWLGKRFMGKIAHEVFEGKKNHKFSEIAPMPAANAGAVAAAPQAQSPAKPPVTESKDHNLTDDEIPF